MTIPFPIAQVNARPVGLAELAASAVARAPAPDRHDSFPVEAIAALRGAGLLAAPLPEALGGAGLCTPAGTERLRDVLRGIGRGNLAVGRIYEGHVNALALVLRYGSDPVRARLAADAGAGHLFGVWNTEPAEPGGLAIGPEADPALAGAKILRVGGRIRHAAAGDARGCPTGAARCSWCRSIRHPAPTCPAGARTGCGPRPPARVDFTGLRVDRLDAGRRARTTIYRQPFFSAGAWRFLAVQCGGIEAVLEAHRGHLAATGRGADPHQLARLGQAATAAETARLFVERGRPHGRPPSPSRATERSPTSHLARGAVERAGPRRDRAGPALGRAVRLPRGPSARAAGPRPRDLPAPARPRRGARRRGDLRRRVRGPGPRALARSEPA